MKKKDALGLVDFLLDNKIITGEIAQEIKDEKEEIGDDIGSILLKRNIVNRDTLILLLLEALKNGVILLDEVYVRPLSDRSS